MSDELARLVSAAADGYRRLEYWVEKYTTLFENYEEFRNHTVYKENEWARLVAKKDAEILDLKESLKEMSLKNMDLMQDVKTREDKIVEMAHDLMDLKEDLKNV